MFMRKPTHNFAKCSLSSAIILATYSLSGIAFAQGEPTPEVEEVIVTGFRASLKAALDTKRETTGHTDAIMAEDIADFPDLNLAESLQRIPGVAITRERGEGKQITVRGLPGRFTQVKINGMETRSATAGTTERSFDFNMFASELFNSLIVRKTASASTGEGSLGPTVELNTSRALDYQQGSTFLVSASGAYNSSSENTKPRIAALYAYNDPNGKWGFTSSLAYSETGIYLNTNNSVRWQKARFNSVKGETCEEGNLTTDCEIVADAFHARIPRYGLEKIDKERLGATLGLQLTPTDTTKITLDALLANFDEERDFNTLEVLFRGNEGGMDVTDYTILTEADPYNQGNDTINSMAVDNAWVRSERFYMESESEFSQFTAKLEQTFTDNFWMEALIGTSTTKGYSPRETTLMYDDRDYDGYQYNYSDSNDTTPVLAFNGPNVTDASIFTLTEIRDRISNTEGNFDNFYANVYWEINDQFTLSGGVAYKKFERDAHQKRRDGTVCGLGLYDCNTDDNDDTNDLKGAPATSALSEIFTYDGAVGAGSTTQWVVPSLSGWVNEFDIYNLTANINMGGTSNVVEESKGGFIQLNGEHPINNMRLMYDVGVRYAQTDQESSGYNSGSWLTIDRPTYDDTLPSLNTALWINEELVVRFSAAKVMSRPKLSDLSPGGSVDSFNYEISINNPHLEPSRAVNLDFSVEWFFAEEALLSLAIFNKDINSIETSGSDRKGTFASTKLPLSVLAPTSPAAQSPEGSCGDPQGCWTIEELQNDDRGVEIFGYELGMQAPFERLWDIPVISNMGLIANYTYSDSERPYLWANTTIHFPLVGMSKHQYNATIYYENEQFSARASWAYRSEYLKSGPNRSGNLWEIVEPSTHLDLSAKYEIDDSWSLTAEVLNLTDEPDHQTVDSDARRLNTYDKTGRNIMVGVRYKL